MTRRVSVETTHLFLQCIAFKNLLLTFVKDSNEVYTHKSLERYSLCANTKLGLPGEGGVHHKSIHHIHHSRNWSHDRLAM